MLADLDILDPGALFYIWVVQISCAIPNTVSLSQLLHSTMDPDPDS